MQPGVCCERVIGSGSRISDPEKLALRSHAHPYADGRSKLQPIAS